MGRYSRFGNALYTGRRSIDFVGRRMAWYLVSIVMVAAAVGVTVVQGLSLGIEFTGGDQVTVSLPAEEVNQDTADRLSELVVSTDIDGTDAPIVTTSGETSILVQTEALTADENTQLLEAISEDTGVPVGELTVSEISASLGSQVAERAVIGIVIFLFLVVLLIWAYFREWKMSVAALVALFHDLAITIGVYALSGFTVTPAAVTGLLAILGFSLYDTVVVFDKVNENTRHLRKAKTTYREAANLAVNQTLVRSVNTSIVALIPTGAILYVSASSLGSSSLQDLALAQFVGMFAGVYSSVFIAPRLLVHLKARESEVVLAEKRAKARKRAAADRYASVPSFAEDMPVQDEPGTSTDEEFEIEVSGREGGAGGTAPRSPQTGAMGKGRTAPSARGPVGDSKQSGRQQPSRQTKSQRKK